MIDVERLDVSGDKIVEIKLKPPFVGPSGESGITTAFNNAEVLYCLVWAEGPQPDQVFCEV